MGLYSSTSLSTQCWTIHCMNAQPLQFLQLIRLDRSRRYSSLPLFQDLAFDLPLKTKLFIECLEGKVKLPSKGFPSISQSPYLIMFCCKLNAYFEVNLPFKLKFNTDNMVDIKPLTYCLWPPLAGLLSFCPYQFYLKT